MQSKRVLIVGCGEIGNRHLQAIAAVPQVLEVEVVEPRPDGLQKGRDRVAEVPDRQAGITFRWLRSLSDASRDGDLCIVATQADVRCQVVRDVANQLGYSSFLLEKIVAQSVGDYENLMECAEGKALSIWVNCPRRAHESFKRVKHNLDPELPVAFTAVGGNYGLATVGVHAADLFLFYDGSGSIECAGQQVDLVLRPSKRGNDVFDLSGAIYGSNEKGSKFVLCSSAEHDAPLYFSLVTGSYRAIVEDLTGTFYESTPDAGWAWTRIPFESDLLASRMTRIFAKDILTEGRCDLPTLKESFPAHRFILTSLQPHFDKLLGAPQTRCPVT